MSPCTWAILLTGVAGTGIGFLAGWWVAVNRLAWRDITEIERHPDDGRKW